MVKVYLVYHHSSNYIDGARLVGVFATEQKAKDAVKRTPKTNQGCEIVPIVLNRGSYKHLTKDF